MQVITPDAMNMLSTSLMSATNWPQMTDLQLQVIDFTQLLEY